MDELTRRRLLKRVGDVRRGLRELPDPHADSPPGDLPTVREDLVMVQGMVTELRAEVDALDPPSGALRRAIDHLADATTSAREIAEVIE